MIAATTMFSFKVLSKPHSEGTSIAQGSRHRLNDCSAVAESSEWLVTAYETVFLLFSLTGV